MHLCNAGRQFVPFLWWSLVWLGRDANPQPTMWEADMLTTKPTQHRISVVICTFRLLKLYNFEYNRLLSFSMSFQRVSCECGGTVGERGWSHWTSPGTVLPSGKIIFYYTLIKLNILNNWWLKVSTSEVAVARAVEQCISTSQSCLRLGEDSVSTGFLVSLTTVVEYLLQVGEMSVCGSQCRLTHPWIAKQAFPRLHIATM